MDVSETLTLARAAPRQTKTETKKTNEKTGESFQDTLTEKVNDSTPTKKDEPQVKVEDTDEDTNVEETKKEVVNVEVAATQIAAQISILNNETVVVENVGEAESETQVGEQEALVAAALDALFPVDEATETTAASEVDGDLAKNSTIIETEESKPDLELETEELTLNAGEETVQVSPKLTVSSTSQEGSEVESLLGVFQNVQNTSVETTTSTLNISDDLQNVNMNQLLNQVEAKIQTMMKTGENSISIKIHPESLGQVNIKLVSGADGVQVYLSAEKPSTGAMLESGIEQLQEILNTAGVNIGSMTVGYQQPQGSNEEMAQWFNRRGFSNGLDLSSDKIELLNGQNSTGQVLTALDYSA